MTTGVGIVSTACVLPQVTQSVSDLLRSEGVAHPDDVHRRLGIDVVHHLDRTPERSLAWRAAAEAIDTAGIDPEEIGVILDYSVLPQDYLVPAWNPSNRLQHELGATGAFTLGFSGAGSSSFQVALRCAVDLLATEDELGVALLFGEDRAIAGNRVLNPEDPISVLGDGASAVVLSATATASFVLGTELVSNGSYHDVCYIPGGGLANWDRPDAYRMEVDVDRLAVAPTSETLRMLAERLPRNLLSPGDEATLVVPNLSAGDQARYAEAFDQPVWAGCATNLARCGHVQATDLVLNLGQALAVADEGDHLLVASHGMGFTAAVTAVRR